MARYCHGVAGGAAFSRTRPATITRSNSRSGERGSGRATPSPLVALNHARAAEEKSGLIHYLRPDYQRSGDPRSPQAPHLPGTEASPQSPISNIQSTIAWPAKLPAQVSAIRQLLATHPTATPEQLSTCFGRKNKSRTEQIGGILETLKGLGRI